MLRRIGVGLGGAAIGAVLGWTIRAFTHWTPAVIIVSILFAILAVLNDARDGAAPTDYHRPTTLFPPDER